MVASVFLHMVEVVVLEQGDSLRATLHLGPLLHQALLWVFTELYKEQPPFSHL